MSEDKFGIRREMPEDQSEIQKVHARVFGPGRFTRTAYRVREAGSFDKKLAWVAFAGEELAGAVRLTPIRIGGRDGALLLGPLIVAPQFAGKSFGRRLITASLEAAQAEGFALVLLVGDLTYYEESGFGPVPRGQIVMPGPVDPARLLAAELIPGTLERYSGLMRAER